MKHICIIANGYPTTSDPYYAFIKPIAQAFADLGVRCTVIAPQSISRAIISRKKLRPYRWIDKSQQGKEIIIYQPKIVSFSNLSIAGNQISALLKDKAIADCFKKEKIGADVIYAHFWERGIVATAIGDIYNIPVFIASGESKIEVRNLYTEAKIQKMVELIDGLICVSSKNLRESIDLKLIRKNLETVILPNGYNPIEFYKVDKIQARRMLNIGTTNPVGVFVGAFSERKGPERVTEAAKMIPELRLMMIGSGQILESDQIVFQGIVAHQKLNTYLNAADFFVLPTFAEGCCNAIIEALACGLPIVSSNLDFNKDILNESNSILVDPSSVEEIARAMQSLIANESLRQKLSDGALKTSATLVISERMSHMICFMDSRLYGKRS